MPSKRKKVVKRSKLRGRTRDRASKYIAEEMRTRKYPRKQAIAIGISRARSEAKKTRTMTTLAKLIREYK
jgi:hypothetical protein